MNRNSIYNYFEQLSRSDQEHCHRVEKLSSKIAQLSEVENINREALSIAAQFHDVGKILVPKCILNKPDKLNYGERQQVMNHSIYSARFLTMSGFDDQVVKLVLLHHENFDGTGYPFGISGADIPIEARIIRVADVFDALRSERVYKQTIGYTACLEQIGNEIQKFDPRIVAVLNKYISYDNEFGEFEQTVESLKGAIL